MAKRIFSGIRPSGDLHIGNYLGAIKRWRELQDDEAFFCIVDEHAITTPHEPDKLRRYTLDTAMAYIAAGIDPKKSTVFVQSHVPAHAELAWILGTMTPLGELTRMTQFREKSPGFKKLATLPRVGRQLSQTRGDPAIIPGQSLIEQELGMAGLLNYPVLMAADILLYQTDVVPVGEDQRQHVELARSIAERFNNRYGKIFALPQAMISEEAARIMSLDDPTKKMSKSGESERGYILLTDSPDAIREKIKAAVTDSGKEIKYDPVAKPAISNLLVIFSELTGSSVQERERGYAGKSYEDFKADLAEAIIGALKPLQKRFSELKEDEFGVRNLLRKGAIKATAIASQTLADVKEKIGFLAP